MKSRTDQPSGKVSLSSIGGSSRPVSASLAFNRSLAAPAASRSPAVAAPTNSASTLRSFSLSSSSIVIAAAPDRRGRHHLAGARSTAKSRHQQPGSAAPPPTAPPRLPGLRPPEGDAELRLEMREGIRRMRDRHRLDEMRLEGGLDRGLDLLDPAHHLADLAARGGVDERDAGARARRIAGG